MFGEGSPEQIAYKLMQDIAKCEGKKLAPDNASREWILGTFAQCLLTVRNQGASRSI
jgi:hypothetical protein